jgi:hypothetical protein
MTQSEELLKRLYDFYKGRYTGQALEDKFNGAVADLVETNDIERGTYVKFCIDNDIEPKTKKETLKHITPRSSYSNDSCGTGSGGYSTDSCGMGSSRSTPTPSRSSYSSDSCGSGSSSYGRSSC